MHILHENVEGKITDLYVVPKSIPMHIPLILFGPVLLSDSPPRNLNNCLNRLAFLTSFSGDVETPKKCFVPASCEPRHDIE